MVMEKITASYEVGSRWYEGSVFHYYTGSSSSCKGHEYLKPNKNFSRPYFFKSCLAKLNIPYLKKNENVNRIIILEAANEYIIY